MEQRRSIALANESGEGMSGRCGWWQRWRLRRRAWRELRVLFDHPERLAGTSLRPAHRGRVDVVDLEDDGGELRAILFTILRHPRPLPFSHQFHAVMQLYRYDLAAERVEHVRSLNLSRERGHSGGEPAGGL